MQKETTNVTVRIPVQQQQQIDSIASQSDRSRNWLINQAIGQYLNNYEKQVQQIDEVMKDEGQTVGQALIAHWQKHGVIGNRPDIKDSQSHARILRQEAETRS